MKYLATIAAIIVSASFCVASTTPALDNARVLDLATTYEKEQKWDVITVWKDARFNERTREWQVFIQTKQNGGPMIVYVSDDTKRIRHVRGE
jgi:hypothetical protein